MRLKISLIMVSLLMAAASARANSYTWINLNGGNWGMAGNWSPNGVPGGGDSAAITTTGNYTVTVNNNQSIGTLTLGASSGDGTVQTLNISSGTFTVNNTSSGTAQGTVNLSGTLAGAGSLALAGAFNFNGGTILNPAGVFANGTLIITNNPGIGQYTYTPGLVYGLLVNGGTATWDTGNLNLNGAGVFSNAPGGTLNWNVGSTLVNNYADNLFANAGQINVTAGNGTASMNPVFNNSGTGTVSIISGTLSLNSGGTDSDSGGGFIISSGTTLNIGGGTYTFNAGSTITGAGNVSMTGGTANFNGTLNVTGNYTINNSTANFNGAYSLGNTTALAIGGTANFSGSGTATVASLNLTGTLGGNNPVNVNGAMTFNGGMILNPAGVFANGTLLITGNPAIGQYTYTPGLVYGLLVNNGVATWNTGNLTLNGAGVLSNSASGIFNWNTGSTLVNNYADNLFANAGKINVTVGSGNTANLNAQFNNSGGGTVTINSGTLSLNGGGTDSDSGSPAGFNIPAGSTLNFGGGTYTFNSGSLITGAGNVSMTGGTANFNGTLNVTGNYPINNGTANFNGAYTIGGSSAMTVSSATVNFNGGGTAALGSLTLNSSTLGGTNAMSVAGAMTFNSSTILNPAGVFANGTLLITGNPAIGQYTYTPGLVYGLLVNNGVATWNTGNLTLNGAGVLSNAPGGTFNWNVGGTLVNNYADNLFVNAGKINVTVGSGNTANLNAQFNNIGAGLVTVNSGTLSLNGGGTDSDSGGGFNVLLGATLNVGNSYTFNASSTISGPGNVNVSSGTGNFNGTLSLTGTYTINNSTANFNGAGTAALVTLTLNSATLTGATPVSVSGAMTFNSSTILNPAGVFANGTLLITGNPAIGQYTYTPGLVYGLLVNNGVATWNTGNLTLNGAGVLSNSASGIFNWNTGSTLVNNYADNLFVNAGKINVTVGSGNTANLNAQFNNSGGGTVTINSGTLSLNGGGADSDSGGGFNVLLGGTLNLGNTYTFNTSSTITGAGNVSMTGGTGNFNGILSLTGTYTINNSTANFNGAGTAALVNLILNSATLTGATPVSVSGAMTFNASTILNPAGVFANGTLVITNNPAIGQYTYTPGLVYGLLVNNGVATWNTGNLTLNGAGVLSNAPGGTFNWNAGGTLVNNYADNLFANAGQVNVAVGSGTASLNAPFVSSGTVTVNSGVLDLNSSHNLTGGTLNFGINSLTSYGQISLSGAAALTGTLSATLNNGFLPAIGNSWQLLSYGSLSGSFTNTNLPPVAVWQTAAGSTALTIKVTSLVPATVWPTPAPIVYGTALSDAQLDASSTIAGSFTYNPLAGTVIPSGNQTLSATFTPNDPVHYSPATLTTTINVQLAPLTVTANSRSKTYGQTVTFAGTEFTNSVLVGSDSVTSVTLTSGGSAANASVSGSPYSIVPGAAVGSGLTNYNISYVNGSLNVGKATPVITWANPSRIIYPAALTGAQLDATANVPGSFVYNPTNGTVLAGGNGQTLSTTFTPTDTTDYNTTNASVTINVVTCDIAPSGLVSWWKGDGNTFDVIGGNTGTLENGVTYTPGEVGQAFNFTAGQQMVVVGNPANLQLQNFTIEAWVQRASTTAASSDTTAVNGSAVLFAYGQGGYGLGMFPNGGLFLTQVGIGSVTTTASVTDTNWHHVAVAATNSGTVVFYTDGVASPAAGSYNPVYQFTTEAAIGGRADNLNGNNNDSFLGAIDEMSVYNRALAEAEIAAIYNAGPGGKCVPLAAITWANPADIVYGAALGGAQLNATANVAGAFSYNPPAGTILPAGNGQTLTNVFTPTDTADYPNPVTNTVTINVDPASLTVTANSVSKNYGQTVAFAGTEFTASALVGSDSVTSVTLTSAGAAANASVSGSPYGIAPGAAVGNGLSNYKITYVDGSLTVNQESLTITARNLSKGYGQALTFAGTEFIATGLQNGETVGSVTLSSAGARNTAPLSGSPYSIVPSAAVGGSFLPTNYDIAYGDGQLTVTPAPLTITASNASKNYGQTLTFAGSEFIASGLFFTDSVTSVTLTSDGAPATGAAGGHSIVPSMAVGTGLGNYTITYGNGLLTVHPASLTITASNASKIYGQTTTFAGTEFISFGLLNSDSIATVRLTSAGAGATAPVSGYAIVPNSAFGTGLGSYTITYNNGTLTVNPASLTITASNLTMTQGAAVPALTAGYSGFVNNENQAVLNGAPALSTTATSNSPVGPYPINVGPGTIFDPNYTYSFVPGTMTVQQPTLTITANDTNMTYGGIVPALSVTYSGFLNGDTAASLTTAPSVSTTGTSLSHVGNWPITASNAVDPNYTIVYVPGTLTINPAPLTITASNASKTYGQTVALPGTAFGSVGLLNGDTIEGVTLSSTGSPPTAAAGPYLIVPSAASGPRAGNYTITYAEGTLTVNPAPLTITAHNAGKYFGQTLTFAGTDFTASGLQNGETVGSVTLTSAGAVSTATVAGSPYPIMPGTATGGTFTAANYTINYVNGSLTVNSVGLPPMINAVLPSAGPNIGGTTVTISGTGFETGATVTFGSLPAASVTVDNSTVLTAVTPASPSGLVNVSVTNADGNSVTASNAFTFGLAPAITTQPTNLSVNQGLNAQFQVQATGDPTLTYQWKFNGNGLLENSHTMGTQTNTLTVNNVGPGDAGYYRCMVSNPYENITSAVAVLSVIVPPTTITVSPQSASAGNGGSASFSATANGTAPSYFWYQDSTLLPGQSGPVLNIANVQANASYTVVASNAAGSVASAPVTVTILTYCASVQAAQATYPEGTTFIPLSVQTFNCGSSAPMPNSGAAVWIYTAGTSRALPVTTDGSGNGTAYFTPLPVEVGLCQYGVALPGQGPPPVQGSFTIIGMNLSAQSESPQLIVGTPQTNTLLLNNLTAVPLTGITATILGAPTNVNVQVSVPASLPGNGAVQTTYVLEGIGTTASQVQFAIQYTSAQGASVTLPFNATVSPPTAQLSAMPASLVGTMIEGSQTLVPFIVTNTGGAASGPIQVNLPAAPWLSVVTAQPIASIAPNQSAQITLALTPTNGQQLGEYPGSLVVQGTNSSVTVPFVFTAVSTLAGNLQVTAQDEFANVGGATVTVSDFLSGATVGTQVTDSSGIVTFTGLTSAYYTVTVQAPDHGNFSTTLLVQANTTTPLTAFLPLQLVDYTWTVTPTTIPDTYNFTLTTVFVTEVPWPVVTVSPGSINLCDFVSGDQVNLVITNSGLIAAEGLQLVIDQSNPDWSIVPLSTNLGNLEAESSIVVPVILTQVGTATDASVPSSISAVVNWYVAALNTTEYNTTPIFIYNANPLNCNPAVGSSTPVTPTVTYPTNGTGPAEPYFDGSVPAPGSGSSQQPVIAQPSYNFPPPATGAIVNVTLQIDQSAVISQNAFHATLNLDNGSGAQVTDLQVTLNPVDANGSPAPNAFFIQPPVLSGVNAVDGTGSLGIGATAQANWTIIPTTNAAPLGSTIYAIGGSISYMLNGEQVTIPLFAVPITVLPEPQLYLDYFLQHDVYSQDPFANVIEPPEPFALGLRVRNLGLGEANGFTITSAQPTIINNANGLLINFQLIDSQVGANTTPVPSLTLDMGDIDPGTNVVGVWWMTASLEGDFTNFQATFQHSDALGGLETSLISSVVIHEMNHVVRITCPSDDGIPDFLCNDTTNVDALPDDVYSSDGNVYPVTSLTGAVAGGVVSSFGSSVTVNDVADIIPGGFVYFQLPDPSGGTLAITSVTRSDGTQLLVGPNVWQTPYRPHMVPPQLANLVHIFDCESTGSYIINYGSTDTVTWATPAPITYGTPLSSIQLDATASVPGSFVYDPPVGTVLTKGTQTLSVIFTPTDTADYGTITQSVSLSVLPASLTITANTNLAKTYGQTKTFAGTEFTATGLVNGDTVTSVTLTSAGSPPTATVPGSPYPVVPGAAVGTGLTNYIITYMDGALNVIPAGLIVTANSVSRALGSSNPTFTGSIVGLQNGDNITASYATTATVNSPAGPYPIVPTLIDPNGKLPNYSVTTNNGTLTVTPGSLSLLCPANITTNYNFAECGQLVAFAPVAAGVPAPVVTCSFNGGVIHSPFVFPVGTNLVSCTASNAAGVDQCCFRVIVIDTNPPVAGPNTLGTYENTVTSEAVAKVLARDSAPSKGPLSIISVTSPTPNGATVTLGHSLITYMPATSFIGLDTLTYTLSDGCGTAPGTILVTTLATNLPTHNVESITVSTAGRTVVFAGVPKANYEIESASFPTGPWSVLSGVITAAANGLVQYTDTTSPVPPVRFYRIKYISGP